MTALISCHPVTFGAWGAPAAIRHLRSSGIGFLELPILAAGDSTVFGEEPLITSDATDSEIAALEALLSDAGLRISSCDVTGSNPASDADFAVLQRKLRVAAALGVPLVVGSAGDPSDSSEQDRLYDRLRELGELSKSLGIVYCLHAEPGLCVDHHGMLDTIEAVGHSHVRLDFDPGNLLYYNRHVQAEVALAKTCHLVRHVRLQDSQGEFGRRYSPALGQGGMIDLYRTRELLQTCGYSGPWSLALHGIEGEPPPPLVVVLERIAISLETLRRLGYFERQAAVEPAPDG